MPPERLCWEVILWPHKLRGLGWLVCCLFVSSLFPVALESSAERRLDFSALGIFLTQKVPRVLLYRMGNTVTGLGGTWGPLRETRKPPAPLVPSLCRQCGTLEALGIVCSIGLMHNK